MATQHETEIPFVLAHEQTRFRLLELPPELLELLSGDNPPVLSLKSSEYSARPALSPAVLCTPGRTYQLRQVNTSNSIFLTRTLPIKADKDWETNVGLCAISRCTDTLETVSVTESAVPYLEEALLQYTGPRDNDENVDMVPVPAPAAGRTKLEVFAGIPLSDEECEDAWVALTAFEHDRSCYIPSSKALVGLWQLLLTSAIAEDVSLDSQFLAQDIWETMQDEGYPEELYYALLRRLSFENNFSKDRWVSLDRPRTVQWVGRTALQAEGQSETGMLVAELTRNWQELLPETWRGDAKVDHIKDAITQMSPTRIRFRNEEAARSVSAKSQSSNGPPPTSRNWHAKLKRSRDS